MSLCVGLWAVKVANKETNSNVYTFGVSSAPTLSLSRKRAFIPDPFQQWQRAETLGALVNGVFLVALCVSIFLEAIQRLVEPQEVQNPQLVFVVGCFGLLSNILGLLLFHDHSHGHGHDHAHGAEENDADVAEQGHVHQHDDGDAHEHHAAEGRNGNTNGNGNVVKSPPETNGSRRRFSVTSRGYPGMEGIHVYPATMRQEIIAAGRENDRYMDEQSSEEDQGEYEEPTERSSLLHNKDRTGNYSNVITDTLMADEMVHRTHNHAQAKPEGEKKKGHHDLNMRGVFLHVMGDALGNIGVIAAALIIWFTDYSWRYYVDPAISLVITVIILASAIPLCKAASRILLQAAPQGLRIDHVKEDIETLPGVIGAHHLHVWQLSDTKIVASVHIKVDTQIQGEGSERYMRLARQVRRCLHAYGIHSSTIQPEFAPDSDAEDNQVPASDSSHGTVSGAAAASGDDPRSCLLDCGEDCDGGRCCPKR